MWCGQLSKSFRCNRACYGRWKLLPQTKKSTGFSSETPSEPSPNSFPKVEETDPKRAPERPTGTNDNTNKLFSSGLALVRCCCMPDTRGQHSERFSFLRNSTPRTKTKKKVQATTSVTLNYCKISSPFPFILVFLRLTLLVGDVSLKHNFDDVSRT